MSKKLLRHTSFWYTVTSVTALIILSPLFYVILTRLYNEDIDESLIQRKNEFIGSTLPSISIADIETWNKFNFNAQIINDSSIKNDTIFNSSYMDTVDAELEPYRELCTPIKIEGKNYTYTSRINLVEKEDLLKSIALLFAAFLSLLLVGMFIINRKLSSKIWKPFHEILSQIEKFQIDSKTLPELKETNIEEFNRLNKSFENLISRNRNIYRLQKEFTENAAHELQTPLAVFRAKIDLLIQSPNLNKDQYDMLESITENITRLSRLNSNLLLLSKIDNSGHHYPKKTVNLNSLISGKIDFFQEQAKQKGISINIDVTNNVEIYGNPDLLEILINNLVINAIQHNIEGGKVSILLANNSLIIKNTGKPGPLSNEKLFIRFSKSDPSGKGTGLGLAIVKKIADLSNWKIHYSFSDELHVFSLQL